MKECDSCIFRKSECIIISPPRLLPENFEKDCPCIECILKTNCSTKCTSRINFYINIEPVLLTES
jgi:hypothetical protein